jgi:hypothetical protein
LVEQVAKHGKPAYAGFVHALLAELIARGFVDIGHGPAAKKPIGRA